MRVARQLCPQLGWNRAWLGVLRARYDRLDPEQRRRLAQLFRDHPPLQAVYKMKEGLCALLRHKMLSRRSCRQLTPQFLGAIQTLRESGLEAALTLAKTLTD